LEVDPKGSKKTAKEGVKLPSRRGLLRPIAKEKRGGGVKGKNPDKSGGGEKNKGQKRKDCLKRQGVKLTLAGTPAPPRGKKKKTQKRRIGGERGQLDKFSGVPLALACENKRRGKTKGKKKKK